jgi:hypothetical protein
MTIPDVWESRTTSLDLSLRANLEHISEKQLLQGVYREVRLIRMLIVAWIVVVVASALLAVLVVFNIVSNTATSPGF